MESIQANYRLIYSPYDTPKQCTLKCFFFLLLFWLGLPGSFVKVVLSQLNWIELKNYFPVILLVLWFVKRLADLNIDIIREPTLNLLHLKPVRVFSHWLLLKKKPFHKTAYGRNLRRQIIVIGIISDTRIDLHEYIQFWILGLKQFSEMHPKILQWPYNQWTSPFDS